MKTEKTQKGNPNRFTIYQHVLPQASIKRFEAYDGRVSVRLRGDKKPLRLLPSDAMFCAKRAWDQRAETGYMKEIEDRFQEIADRILEGQDLLSIDESAEVTNFYSLWCLRFQHRYERTPDHVVNGIVGELLSKTQEENLEANQVTFIRADQRMPGRFVAGLRIQMGIHQMATGLRGKKWGVARACKCEFIAPDTFGKFAVVPLSPQACLTLDKESRELSRPEVEQVNTLATTSFRKYLIARDFERCPLHRG
jgi:hypothetical protein